MNDAGSWPSLVIFKFLRYLWDLLWILILCMKWWNWLFYFLVFWYKWMLLNNKLSSCRTRNNSSFKWSKNYAIKLLAFYKLLHKRARRLKQILQFVIVPTEVVLRIYFLVAAMMRIAFSNFFFNCLKIICISSKYQTLAKT